MTNDTAVSRNPHCKICQNLRCSVCDSGLFVSPEGMVVPCAHCLDNAAFENSCKEEAPSPPPATVLQYVDEVAELDEALIASLCKKVSIDPPKPKTPQQQVIDQLVPHIKDTTSMLLDMAKLMRDVQDQINSVAVFNPRGTFTNPPQLTYSGPIPIAISEDSGETWTTLLKDPLNRFHMLPAYTPVAELLKAFEHTCDKLLDSWRNDKLTLADYFSSLRTQRSRYYDRLRTLGGAKHPDVVHYVEAIDRILFDFQKLLREGKGQCRMSQL